MRKGNGARAVGSVAADAEGQRARERADRVDGVEMPQDEEALAGLVPGDAAEQDVAEPIPPGVTFDRRARPPERPHRAAGLWENQGP